MDSFKDCLISPQATVLQAVEAVQCGKHSIAIVVDEKQRLLGIVTDFDLRKAILKGDAGLSIPVSEIMNQSPVTAPVNMSRENLIKLHQQKRVTQIPLLDNNRRVVGLETFFHLMETSCGYHGRRQR
jgi:CBS domain-containing protein